MDFLDDEQKQLIFALVVVTLLLVTIGLSVYQIFFKEMKDCVCKVNEVLMNEREDDSTSELEEIEEVAIVSRIFHVDIKGAVINPGVYEVNETAMINDVISMAGGLKSNASTKYLNLSMKVIDEMVINIYTAYEISLMNMKPSETCVSKTADISDCKDSSVVIKDDDIDETGSNNSSSENIGNGKVSLNKGTKEQLMTLPGIGEAKAVAIIEYREKNGGFKTLEEIKNVSGIGDAAFEKIKDSIEL